MISEQGENIIVALKTRRHSISFGEPSKIHISYWTLKIGQLGTDRGFTAFRLVTFFYLCPLGDPGIWNPLPVIDLLLIGRNSVMNKIPFV